MDTPECAVSYPAGPYTVNFRRATLADRDEILAIDENIFGGMDYLHHWLNHHLVATNRHCIVGEIDNQVVFFAECILIDGGQRCILRAGRVKKEMRGLGISYLFRLYIARVVLTRFPQIEEWVWVMLSKTSAALNDSFWEERRIRTIRFLVNYEVRSELLRTKPLPHAAATSSAIKWNDLKRHDFIDLCRNREHRPQLFHSAFMVVSFEPYELLEDNVEEIFAKLTYAKYSQAADGTMTGVSFLVESPFRGTTRNERMQRSDLDIYSNSTEVVIAHICHYLSFVARGNEKSTTYLMVTFDKRCDYHAVVAFVDSLGLTRAANFNSMEVISIFRSVPTMSKM